MADPRMRAALPERVWILTHPAWKDDATRQTYEVITSPAVATGYIASLADEHVAQSFAGFEIAEYERVRAVQS